ncbi:hypothetical protein DRJ22_01855 [Candidatus Woesearchaeota archaeon]|nr:MAG: hypothetical protein DRJ22_01855 [Candidatus Woesearchaeota archaeon]
MDELVILRIVLAIIIGTLVAIAYSVRYLILLERRIAKIEIHTERLVSRFTRGTSNAVVKTKPVKRKTKKRR